MANANQEVVNQLNDLAQKRFALQVEVDQSNRRFKESSAKLEAEHAKVLEKFQAQITALDTDLWEALSANRDSLIVRGRKSFATMLASFQLRDQPAKMEVTDAKLAMTIARKLGLVKRIAKLSVKWTFNATKFIEWLKRNGEHREDFADCIEDIEASESLTIKPNAAHTVYYDGKRLSPPSITIQKS